MATVTSTPTATSLTVSGNTTKSGTISWTKPTVPSGATITSCVLTGRATASMSKGSATIKVNNQTVTSGSTFTVNLGTGNTTTSVTTSAVGNNKNASGTVTFSDLVYTVTYTAQTYTVTFKDWNGTTLKTEEVEVGGSATPPSNPTRTGYTFTGWSGSYTNVTANTTVTAQYTIKTYTVTFKDWDGTVLSTQQIQHGGSATPPSIPSMDGYTFKGWSGSYTNITANTTITAQYERHYHLIWVTDDLGTPYQVLYEMYTASSSMNFLPEYPGDMPSGYIYEGTNPPAGDYVYGDMTIWVYFAKIEQPEEPTVGGINLGYSIAKSLYVGLKKILYVYVGNSLVYGGNLNVDPPIDVVNLLVPFEDWGMDNPSQATITTMQGNNLNIVVRGEGGSPYTMGMNLVANKTYTIKADTSTVGLIMCDSSWGNWTEISRDELLAGYVFMSSATFTIMGILLTTGYPCTATISNLMVTEGGEFVEVILPPFEKWGADNSSSISVITCSGGNLRATVTAGDGYPYVAGGVKIYTGERYTVKADSSNVDLMLIDETWEYNSNTIIITSSQMVEGYTFTASANYIFVGFVDYGTYPFTIDVVNLTVTRS